MALTKPRAYQIYDIDYKQATRVVTVTNITLTGGAPNNVDGVTLSLDDRVLVTGQSAPTQNGIYIITTLGSGSNGTWARSNDTNETGELLAGTIVMVTEGVIYADTQWKLITDNPIAIGTTPLVFTQNYYANVLHAGNSNVTVYSNANVTITAAGAANVLTVASDGVYVIGNVSASGNVTANYVLGNGYNLTGLANVTFGNAPPTSNLVAGDIWIDSTTGIQYIWFNDVTGNVWAEMEAQTAYSSTGYANLTTNTLNTQILYNSANAIVGSNALTFDGTTVSVTGIAVNANLSITGNTIQSTASNANLTITTTGSAAYVNMTGGFGVYSSGGNRLIQTVSDTVNFYTPMLNSLDSAIDIIGTPDGNIIPVNNTGVMLHITGQPTLPSRIYNDAANSYAAFIGRAINGNVNAPTQITAGQTVARFAAQPYANGAYPAISTTRIDMVATETQTTANAGSQIIFWTTPTGSNVVTQVMSLNNANLSITGNIITSGSITSGTYSGNLVPAVDNTYFLGNATNRWANLWLGPGTLYITDSANTANVARLTVQNGVLEINGVNQIQAPGIANGNANIVIGNTGNVTITTLPGMPNLDWVFDNSGNMRFASVTEQDNFIGENNGDFFMSGTQSVKLGAGLSGNLVLTVNSANVEVGAGRDYTDQFNVYGTMHAVFNNLYETGGDITADKNVYVGRLTVSDQPGDPNIPGITANSTSTDFSLGVLNDTGNLVINRNVIRNGNHGATDTVTNYSPDVPVGVNTPYQIYGGTDTSILAVELTVILQYGTTSDTDTELTKLLATMNAGGTANLVVLGQSLTTTAFAPATYTAGVAGGVLTVSVQTAADSSTAYYRYHASEFGGYFGA